MAGGFIPSAGTETHIKADMVLLALGFVGPEREGCWTNSASTSPAAARSTATTTT